MAEDILPIRETLWKWDDNVMLQGAPFVFEAGDDVKLEITHGKSGAVVLRQATFTAGTNAVSYQPVDEDVAVVETLLLRWQITRGGLIGHFPTYTKFPLRLIE